jgi:hypothetical protein
MTSSCCDNEFFGADPSIIQWKVVRGDTSPLRVEFFETDETTPYDTSTWEYAATTYDFRGDVLDRLDVEAGNGFVNITAPASITQLWGTGYGPVVAELAFDLQVTIDDDTIWTPVIGTISVLGDVTGGSL